MAHTAQLVDFTGSVDYVTIDRILNDLKKNRTYGKLAKTTAKRVYAILVECLENISKHAIPVSDDDTHKPYVSVSLENEVIVIRAGNPVTFESIKKLDIGLELINALDDPELLSLYDSKINTHQVSRNCAGLGFMLMKLKSKNNIGYRYTEVNKDIAFFEIKITINQHTMRKLIIDQTSNSPKVVFDPDSNKYEISGESRPPDVTGFYTDILNWFDDYSKQLLKTDDGKNVVIDLDFEYFNSSSAKYILDLCKKVSDMRSRGKEILIKWHYEDDDYDMLETGREMSKMARVPFEYTLKQKK